MTEPSSCPCSLPNGQRADTLVCVEPSHGLRLRVSEPPDVVQLRMLRASFPDLTRLPLAALRARLTERPVFVVGCFVSRAEGEHLVKQLASVGLRAELFGDRDYGARYVRSVLPPPDPTWASAETALELVFRPAFDPEVILRLWKGERDWLQLVSLLEFPQPR